MRYSKLSNLILLVCLTSTFSAVGYAHKCNKDHCCHSEKRSSDYTCSSTANTCTDSNGMPSTCSHVKCPCSACGMTTIQGGGGEEESCHKE